MPRGAIPASLRAVTPDGERVVASAADGTLVVWDKEFKKEPLVLHGPAPGHHSFAFSLDGKWIVQGCSDGNVRVRSTEKEDPAHLLKRYPHRVLGIAFSPDGKLLAAGTNYEFTIFDAATFEEKRTVKESGGWLAFAADSKSIWSAKHDHDPNELYTVARIDVATGTKLPTISLKIRGGWGFYALSPDRKTLYAHSTNDSFIGVYDLDTGTEKFPPQGHDGPVYCLAVSPDGRTLASGGADHTVRLWDLGGWKAGAALPPVRVLAGRYKQKGGIWSVAFSPDGKLLASGCEDGTIALWDVASGAQGNKVLRGNSTRFSHVAFSPDGQTLAVGGADGKVFFFTIATGKVTESWAAHGKPVREVAFSPNGKLMASAGEDRFVRLWEVATGDLVVEFESKTVCTSVAFSQDSRTLAAGTDAPEDLLRVWDIADPPNAKLKGELRGHTSHVYTLAFQPGGSLVATGGWDGTARLWDLDADGTRALTIRCSYGPNVYGVAFSPEGGYLVTANDNATIAILKVPKPPVAYAPGSPRPLPDPLELSKRPSPADALKREDIPADLLAKAGGGDPQKAPPELVAVLSGENGHSGQVWCLAVSPDGKALASGGQDKTIRLWDLAAAKPLHTLAGHNGDVWSVVFSPDGKYLASASGDHTVKLWQVADGKEQRTLTGHTDVVWSVAISPDGKTLASGSYDSTARLWDMTTGRLVRTYDPRAGKLWVVSFSPDSKTLATGGEDGVIHLWDAATGWLQSALRGGHSTRIVRLAFRPDGQALASSSGDRTIRLWDLTTFQSKQLLEGAEGHPTGLAWRADGRLLASAGHVEGTARVLDVGDGPPRLKTFPLFPQAKPFLHDVALTPEGRFLATANPDGTVYILRLAERGTVYQVPPDPVELQPRAALPAHTGPVTWTVFAPDGKTIATAGKDGTVKLWDAGKDTPRLSVDAHKDGVRCVVFASDGRTLATAGFNGTIRIWDAEGKKQRELTGHKGQIAVLLIAPNGSVFAAGESGSAYSWSAGHEKEPKRLQVCADWITHLSLTPDGKSLATSGNDWTVRLWDVAAWKEVRSLAEHTSVCFSPNGKLLATGTRTHAIKLHDATTLEFRRRLDGHTDAPDGFGFSADGKLLASCGTDGGLRVWDASRGHLLAVLRGHKGRAWAVALSADGKTLAAGDEEGKLLLWDLSGLSRGPAR
jgi:WD40 repeat protein